MHVVVGTKRVKIIHLMRLSLLTKVVQQVCQPFYMARLDVSQS